MSFGHQFQIVERMNLNLKPSRYMLWHSIYGRLYSLSAYLYYIQIILTASIEKFTRSPHIPGNPNGAAGLTSSSYATTPGSNDEHVIKHIVIL